MRSTATILLVIALAGIIVVGGCPPQATVDGTLNGNGGILGSPGSNTNANGATTVAGGSADISNPSDATNENGNDNENVNAAANANANRNTSGSNANANTNGGGAGNANANANDNSNTNGSANANQNASTNANQNTNSNGSGNANANANINTNGNGLPVDSLYGHWTGTLPCTVVQSVGGTTSQPFAANLVLEVNFDANQSLTSLTVVNFSDAPDQVATVSLVGDRVFLEGDTQPIDARLRVTVSAVTYSTGQALIGLSLLYHGVDGSLVQSGPGTQSVTVTRQGSQLAITLHTEYAVQQSVGALVLQTGEVIDCTGVLDRMGP